MSRLFLDGSSPLKDEAENGFLRELQGKSVSIIRYLADNPGSYVGDIAAALTKTNNSAELGSYLAALISKYKTVEKRLSVFAESTSRSAPYYLTDNFLQACDLPPTSRTRLNERSLSTQENDGHEEEHLPP